MLRGIRKITWTSHARQRATEIGVTGNMIDIYLKNSLPVTLKKTQVAYKFSQYGLEALDDVYLMHRRAHVLFTAHRQGEELVIITVTRTP